MHQGSEDDRHLAAHATDAPSLERRIEDMERRLMVERAQAVAHARAFGGNVRRRLTSPTSLVFAGSVGFVAAEILSARAGKGPRRGSGASRLKSAGKSLFGALAGPLLSMAQLGSMGFLVKESKDTADTTNAVQAEAGPEFEPPTLH